MRLLLIEGNKETRKFLDVGLRGDFVIDHAEDGEKGSFLGRINEYDLIILNNELFKKAGLQVCQEIREAEKTAFLLVISKESAISQKIAFFNAGADDYINTPFSLDELLARIRVLFRRSREIKKDLLIIDDLVINRKTYQVTRDKEIYLTKKEFMLLEYLVLNKGAVITRGMLIDHVWDMQLDPFSNTIEMHIAKLRKKIDVVGKKKLILTMSGRGYKIDA